MKSRKVFSLVILFIFIVCLYSFFKSIMFEEIIIGESFGMNSIVCLFLAFIPILYFLCAKKLEIMKLPFVKSYVIFTIVSYVIALLYSLFYPFDARITYVLFPLPLLLFIFIYQITSILNSKTIIFFISFLLIMLSVNYFRVYSINYFNGFRTMASSIFLFFMPFLLTIEKSRIKNIGIVLILIIIAFSMKRTAFLAFVLGMIVYFFVNKVLIENKKIKGLFSFISIIFILLILIFYIIETNDIEIIDRFKNIKEDGGSGRDVVFDYSLKLIMESSLPELIFGHGFDMVIKDSLLKVSAHNEFLEITYDFGVISLIIFIVFLINIIKYTYTLIKFKSKYAAPMATSIIIFIISSMTSHTYLYTKHMIIFTLFWGYIIACVRKEQIKI